MLEAMLESRSRVRVRSGDIYIRQPINELFYAVENGTIHHHCDDDGLRLDEVSSTERERGREREDGRRYGLAEQAGDKATTIAAG